MAMLLAFAGTAFAQGLSIDITDGSSTADPIAVVPFAFEGAGLPPETDVSEIVRADLAASAGLGLLGLLLDQLIEPVLLGFLLLGQALVLQLLQPLLLQILLPGGIGQLLAHFFKLALALDLHLFLLQQDLLAPALFNAIRMEFCNPIPSESTATGCFCGSVAKPALRMRILLCSFTFSRTAVIAASPRMRPLEVLSRSRLLTG